MPFFHGQCVRLCQSQKGGKEELRLYWKSFFKVEYEIFYAAYAILLAVRLTESDYTNLMPHRTQVAQAIFH